MKKILTTILVFLGLLTIGISIGANAADETVTFEFYNEDKLTSTSGTGITKDYLNSKITSEPKNFVTNLSLTNTVQYDKNGGLTTGTGSKAGTMVLTLSSEVKKVEIIGAEYDTGNKFTVNNTEGTGSLAAKHTKLAEVTESVVWDLASSTNELTITTTKKSRATIYKLILTVGSTAGQSYSVSFDANGGAFVDGKGAAIENIASGTETTVTLPVAADLSSTPYSNTTVLSKWSDGTTEYDPGATVIVNKGTKYTAQYVAPENPISMANAISICEEVGGVGTSLMFSVEGTITEVKDLTNSKTGVVYGHSVVITDGTNNLEAYNLTNSGNLVVGDTIIVTGSLKNYNGTNEFDAKCTYKMINSVAATNFVASETKTSLIVKYDGTLNPTDVDLRFGGIIAADAYNAGAKYGVLVVAGEKTLTAGKTEFANVDEFIAANAGFKNVECTPAQVDGGYQFAWVISDMEGHYSDTLTGVMYMEYEGVLYICGAKTSSVKATIEQYLNSDLTDEQLEVLVNLDGLCQ